MEIEIERMPNGNLKLTADAASAVEIAEAQADGRDYYSIMADLFEGYSCNGSYTHFNAGDGDPFVGLTDAPCIAEAMDYPDNGSKVIQGEFWHYADYVFTNELDELAEGRAVIYTLAR